MNQELEAIRPTTNPRVMDLVREAGVDVSDWSNMKNGNKNAASNPKYCYAWSFVQPGKVVVLNLWFDFLRQNTAGIEWRSNMRKHGDKCKLHSEKDVWAKRAYEMDRAIQHAVKENLPIRVIVCNGTMLGLDDSQQKASQVNYRLLDPVPWSVTNYDMRTGECVLTRGLRDTGEMKEQYSQFICERNLDGSNKAASYIRALELLDGILKKTKLFGCRDFWSVESIDKIERLYEYALQFQKQSGTEFLQPDLPPSYGQKGWYSAALKSYKEFLVLNQHEQQLWGLVNQPDVTPSELSKRLSEQKIDSIEELVSERDIDFSTKEGKEVLRETKARVNQGFFRKMVLTTYETQCCVSGLNIPEVLRASHIVAWSEDEENRMNPTNGLCLSATYDAAFDRHLISFDEDYRMIFSPQLKEYYSNEAFKTQFRAFEGKRISFPKRFYPDQAFLEKHRAKIPA